MIYLLLDSTDKKTIKSVSTGEFKDFPEEYISVGIETEDEEGLDLGNVPEGFNEDYSLFEWDGTKIIERSK